MSKATVILKKAILFEKLSKCEDKRAMLKVFAEESVDAVIGDINTLITNNSSITAPISDSSTETAQSTLQQLTAEFTGNQTVTNEITLLNSRLNAASNPADAGTGTGAAKVPGTGVKQFADLKNSAEIAQFQRSVSGFMARNPSFKAAVDKALNPPWGKGKNNDVDGKMGPRTSTVYKLFQETYQGSKATDLNQQDAGLYTQVWTNLVSFRQKLQIMNKNLGEYTKNFTVKENKGSDDVRREWTAFLNPPLDYISQGINNKTITDPQLLAEAQSLLAYFDSLCGSYMQAPMAEPASKLPQPKSAAAKIGDWR